MRGLIFLLLTLLGPTAAAYEVTICYNYDCAVEASVHIGTTIPCNSSCCSPRSRPRRPKGSRSACRGLYEPDRRAQTPVFNDKGGNDNEEEVNGRMDCIDHSRTTTTYLRFIEARGWLQFHRVLEPIHRARC